MRRLGCQTHGVELKTIGWHGRRCPRLEECWSALPREPLCVHIFAQRGWFSQRGRLNTTRRRANIRVEKHSAACGRLQDGHLRQLVSYLRRQRDCLYFKRIEALRNEMHVAVIDTFHGLQDVDDDVLTQQVCPELTQTSRVESFDRTTQVFVVSVHPLPRQTLAEPSFQGVRAFVATSFRALAPMHNEAQRS